MKRFSLQVHGRTYQATLSINDVFGIKTEAFKEDAERVFVLASYQSYENEMDFQHVGTWID